MKGIYGKTLSSLGVDLELDMTPKQLKKLSRLINKFDRERVNSFLKEKIDFEMCQTESFLDELQEKGEEEEIIISLERHFKRSICRVVRENTAGRIGIYTENDLKLLSQCPDLLEEVFLYWKTKEINSQEFFMEFFLAEYISYRRFQVNKFRFKPFLLNVVIDIMMKEKEPDEAFLSVDIEDVKRRFKDRRIDWGLIELKMLERPDVQDVAIDKKFNEFHVTFMNRR